MNKTALRRITTVSIVFVVIAFSICVWSYFKWKQSTSIEYGASWGPLLTSTEVAKDGFTTTGQNCKVGTAVVFGGFPFPIVSSKAKNYTIQSIVPTNIPRGLRVINIRLLKAPKGKQIWGCGPVDFFKKVNIEPVVDTPFSLTDNNKTVLQPLLTAEAQKPGLYVIYGLLITYVADGKTYTDYFRDQFVLNAGRPAVKSGKVPAPPMTWTVTKKGK